MLYDISATPLKWQEKATDCKCKDRASIHEIFMCAAVVDVWRTLIQLISEVSPSQGCYVGEIALPVPIKQVPL